MENDMKQIATRAAFLLALCAPLLAVSHAAYAEDAAAAQLTDEQLAATVKGALDADPELAKLNLKVTSKKGDIKIEGTMTDDQQMVRAGTIAEKIPGVKNVLNDMKM
jgi:hyperosmotically inducible protein